ncbi:MAG: methyltransferase domain-containing protein [Bacteroidetes bacterium]|nr:methyltransferase domain-containing protein [Bacteroidota bacterium]
MAGKPDFSHRSKEKELLDRNDIPFGDIRQNMLELNTINTWLGGHAITIKGIKQLAAAMKLSFSRREKTGRHDLRQISVCEIGCGGGDNLRVLSRKCRQWNISVDAIGIDNNLHCVNVAQQEWKEGGARWIHSDYRDIEFGDKKPDIIFSSLFCHHFSDEELVGMLQWMERNAATGWFINDLHRHPLAWNSIRLLTRLFSRSYLVRHDAPLSVLRGFSRGEWENILQTAAIGEYSLEWKWAFRWLVVSKKIPQN